MKFYIGLDIDPIEEMPLFDGRPSDDAFHEYVYKNLKNPLPDFDCSGRVIVTFVIEKDGSVSNAEVVRGLRPALDAEALRAIRSSSGKWMPGKLSGKPVRVKYTFPVRFILEAKDTLFIE